MVQLNPVPVFGTKKKMPAPFNGTFFTEIFVQMVSSVNLSIDTNQPPLVVGVFCRTYCNFQGVIITPLVGLI